MIGSSYCHNFDDVTLGDFVSELAQAELQQHDLGPIPHPEPAEPFVPAAAEGISLKRFFQRLNAQLDSNTIVIAEVGEALFGSIDMRIHEKTEFFSPIVYGSMGFAVPASVGVQMADPKLRPLVLVGDGAFQMTGMEISTAARLGLNPVIVVLNNYGYSTERAILDGPYNDLHPWRFGKIPEIVGAGTGFTVDTEDQLDQAIAGAWANTDSFSIIDVHLSPADRSPALERLAERIIPSSI